MNKKLLWNAVGSGATLLNRIENRIRKNAGHTICFDTSIGTENMGDHIIMHYCNKALKEWWPDQDAIHVGTHRMPSPEDGCTVRRAGHRFVCGTNLLTSHIEQYWRWILPDGLRGKWKYRNVILLGVGWGEYQDECSDYSRMIYRMMLNPDVIHSVRDQYTLEKLRQAGICNVLNTGCPTTWALTPEHCRDIPTQKAKNVVATITDYRRNPELDNQMLDILSRNYDHIYLWLQGKQDAQYLSTLNIPENLTTIPGSLEAYEAVLRGGNVDYVGTRLHAGIHALNYKIRSIILAVDNRATEMGRDVNLPVIQREQIGTELEEKIRSEFKTEIVIKQDMIQRFAAQFQG